jgi:hypothetical protein
MIAHAWHCDGPGCDSHTAPLTGSYPPLGWCILAEGTGTQTQPVRVGEFCGIDCVMKYAAQFPPVEEIPMHDEDEA